MAVCASCGASVSENTGFCASCGTQALGAAPPAGEQGRGPLSTDFGSNAVGALAYLGGIISGLIIFLIERYNKNPFVRFHTIQSILLSGSVCLTLIALGVISGMLGTGFLWSLIALLKYLVSLAFMLLSLFMMYKALRGERFSLPYIGTLAAKWAG
jgi:uncharacterized membrane protein